MHAFRNVLVCVLLVVCSVTAQVPVVIPVIQCPLECTTDPQCALCIAGPQTGACVPWDSCTQTYREPLITNCTMVNNPNHRAICDTLQREECAWTTALLTLPTLIFCLLIFMACRSPRGGGVSSHTRSVALSLGVVFVPVMVGVIVKALSTFVHKDTGQCLYSTILLAAMTGVYMFPIAASSLVSFVYTCIVSVRTPACFQGRGSRAVFEMGALFVTWIAILAMHWRFFVKLLPEMLWTVLVQLALGQRMYLQYYETRKHLLCVAKSRHGDYSPYLTRSKRRATATFAAWIALAALATFHEQWRPMWFLALVFALYNSLVGDMLFSRVPAAHPTATQPRDRPHACGSRCQGHWRTFRCCPSFAPIPWFMGVIYLLMMLAMIAASARRSWDTDQWALAGVSWILCMLVLAFHMSKLNFIDLYAVIIARNCYKSASQATGHYRIQHWEESIVEMDGEALPAFQRVETGISADDDEDVASLYNAAESQVELGDAGTGGGLIDALGGDDDGDDDDDAESDGDVERQFIERKLTATLEDGPP